MVASDTEGGGAPPELILFGGSFDPPHLGHLDVLGQALRRFPAAKALVLPSPEAPRLAGDPKPKAAASFKDRLTMCQLAFGDLRPTVEVSPLEDLLPKPSFTVQTLARLRVLYGRASLSWLIGGDQLRHFHEWRDPAGILDLAHLIVMPRLGEAHEDDDLQDRIDQIRQALGRPLPVVTTSQPAPSAHAGGLFLLPPVAVPAASRTIRDALERGDAPEPNWLDPRVATYIREHRLYCQKEA